MSPMGRQEQSSPQTISRLSFDGYQQQQQQFQAQQQQDSYYAQQQQFNQLQQPQMSPSCQPDFPPNTQSGSPPQSPYGQHQPQMSQDSHTQSGAPTPSSSLFSPGPQSLYNYTQEQVHQQQQQQQSQQLNLQSQQPLAPSMQQDQVQVSYQQQQHELVSHQPLLPAQPHQRSALQQQLQRFNVPQEPASQCPPQAQLGTSTKPKGTYAPEDFIENPDPGTTGPYGIQCRNCHNISKTKSDFYRHLSERHYKAELARELPRIPPFKCPFAECHYETKDNSVAPLIKHYGIVHKAVQKYLVRKTVGKFVPNEKKASGPKHVALQQHPASQEQAGFSGLDPEQYNMTINQVLHVKCSFCELVFVSRYAFHQHLCDKHFKDNLAQQLPVQPPFSCPVINCMYIAKDSRQSLIRHYGMTHKLVVELLKRHAPFSYVATETPQQQQHPLPSMGKIAESGMNKQLSGYHSTQASLQYGYPQATVQEASVSQGNEFFHQPQQNVPPMDFQQQKQEQQCQHHYLVGQQHHQQQQQMQHHSQIQQQHLQNQQCVNQPPAYGHHLLLDTVDQHMQHSTPQTQLLQQQEGRSFDQQINGTFDPSLYGADSSDGIKSLSSTPVKEASLKSTSPLSNASSVAAASTSSSAASVSTATSKNGNQAAGDKKTVSQEEAKSEFTKPSKAKALPKFCEVCGKVFEGKNKAMLKIQHLAQHFKHKLFEDLPNKSAPFTCPIEGCTYQTKHKPDWARHYGSVHKFIDKYLKEHLAMSPMAKPIPKVTPTDSGENSAKENPPAVEVTPAPSQNSPLMISEFLPKAELSQILSTALDQQSQPDKNFGVVTVQGTPLQHNVQEEPKLEQQQQQQQPSQLDLIDEMLQDQEDVIGMLASHREKPGEPTKLQCFMCDDGEEFKSEEALNEHITTNHFDFTEEFQSTGEKLTLLSTADVEATLVPTSMAAPLRLLHTDTAIVTQPQMTMGTEKDATATSLPSSLSSSSSTTVDRRIGGRPCEICGYEPKTKNKSRERSDHLAMKHYKERIEQDLAKIVDLTCPICGFKGKDKQTIYRHYTGKHRVVEKYLADDLASGKVVPLLRQQMKQVCLTQQQSQQLQQQGHQQVKYHL